MKRYLRTTPIRIVITIVRDLRDVACRLSQLVIHRGTSAREFSPLLSLFFSLAFALTPTVRIFQIPFIFLALCSRRPLCSRWSFNHRTIANGRWESRMKFIWKDPVLLRDFRGPYTLSNMYNSRGKRRFPIRSAHFHLLLDSHRLSCSSYFRYTSEPLLFPQLQIHPGAN